MAKRRARWLLWLVGIVGALLVLVVSAVVLGLRSQWFEDSLTETIVTEVNRATHESAAVSGAQVTFFPPGAVIRDLRIVEDQTGDEIVYVEQIFAPLTVGPGGIGVGRLQIDNPAVHLHIDKAGKLREFTAPPTNTPGPAGKPLTKLPFDSIALTGGTVRIEIPEGEVSLEALALQPAADGTTRLLAALDVRWREFEDHADIDMPGISLGPTVIDVPQVALALGALQIGGEAHVPLQGDLDLDLTLHSSLANLSPLLNGPRFLEGIADADVRIEGPLSALTSHVVANVQQFGYRAPGKVWPEIHYTLDSASVTADIVNGEIIVTEAVIREENGTATATGVVRRVEVSPGAPPQWQLFDGVVHGSDLSLAAILRAVDAAPNPWVDFEGDADATISGPLQPLELNGTFAISLDDFVVTQGPEDETTSPQILHITPATVKGELTIFKDHIVLDCQQVHTPRNDGTVLANIGFQPQGPLDLQIDLTRTNLRDLRPLGGSELTGYGRVRGRLAGPFNGLHFNGRGWLTGFSSNGVPYADELTAKITSDMKKLALTEVDARVGDTHYLGTWQMDFATTGLPMETDVLITHGRVADLVHMFVDVPGIDGVIEEGTLELAGPLNQLDGEAHLTLEDVDLLGERFETGRADGYMDEGTFTLEDLRVRRGDDEGLTLSGSVGRKWALSMDAVAELRLENLNQVRAFEAPLTGRATATAHIGKTLFDPEPRGRITVWETTFADRPVQGSVATFETHYGLTHVKGDLVGGTIDADGTIGLWDEQSYDLHAYFDSFPVDRLYPVAADGQQVIATLSGDVHLYGDIGEEPSPMVVMGEFPRVVLGWDRHTLINEEPWAFSMEGNHWFVRNVALFGGNSKLSLSAEGRDDGNLVHGSGTLDADLLRAVVPGLYRSEGTVDVSVASIGKAGAAKTHIDLDLQGALMRHESVPAALEDVTLKAAITPDAYLLHDFRANVGGGELVGSALDVKRVAHLFPEEGPQSPAGVIEAEGWLPKRFDLHAAATDVQMKWVEDLPPAVGDAGIIFDGPADELLLHADVEVKEMAFTDRIDWEDWVVALEEYLLVEAPPTDEEPWFGLDIDIHADRTIRLLNNVSDATASADLQMVGNTSRMGMLGRVSVEDGDIFVQDRSFSVKRGEFIFDNPYSWDPLLDFDLQTDIQSRQRQFRVNYRILGPYSTWTSRTRSDPPLPQSDINALLWFGVTADELEDMGELTNAVSMAAADFVFKDVFLQNDYLGLGLERSGVLTRLPELDLNTGVNLRGEYSSDPRVLLKQRLSPELVTQAEFNFLGDEYFVRIDWRADETLVLSSWWASRRREGFALPFNGALGADIRWVREFD